MAAPLLVGLIACGPAVDSDGEASSTTRGMDATTNVVPPEPGSEASTTGWISRGDVGECSTGSQGCPCGDADTCDDGLHCDGGLCRPLPPDPLCGNGVLDETEQCDDGNTASHDGCSESCAWERHCFVAQLTDGDDRLHTLSFGTDGLLTPHRGRAIAPMHPAPDGLGHSTTACGERLAHASHAAGRVALLGPFETLPIDSSGTALDGVLEVGCDPSDELLFATAFTGPGFTLALHDTSDGLAFVDALDIADTQPRVFVDDDAHTVYWAIPGAPTQLFAATYTREGFGPVHPFAAELALTGADDLVVSGATYVVPSGREDGQTAFIEGRMAYSFGGVLSDRTNATPLPRIGESVFALGGEAGVVIAEFSNQSFTQHGDVLLPEVSNTVVRAAMDGTLLVVGSPQGIHTFGRIDTVWTELDRLAFDPPVSIESGAVVPCG